MNALPQKVSGLLLLWEELQNTRDAGVLKSLTISVHNLAGSAGTFGFVALSDKARRLEKALLRYQDDPELDHANSEGIAQDLQEIRLLVQHGPDHDFHNGDRGSDNKL